jgi:hypothetical protein
MLPEESVTWLRSDASLLAIQVLRGRDVPHNERICSICHNRTEIEEHLYNNCMALDPTWNDWKSEVFQHIPQTILVVSTHQRILSRPPNQLTLTDLDFDHPDHAPQLKEMITRWAMSGIVRL